MTHILFQHVTPALPYSAFYNLYLYNESSRLTVWHTGLGSKPNGRRCFDCNIRTFIAIDGGPMHFMHITPDLAGRSLLILGPNCSAQAENRPGFVIVGSHAVIIYHRAEQCVESTD